MNDSPRPVSSGDQGDCTTESHRYSTTEIYTINPGGQNRATKDRGNRKNVTKNGKTKKQPPNERKGGTLRKNAN